MKVGRGGHKIAAKKGRDFLGTKLFQEFETNLKKRIKLKKRSKIKKKVQNFQSSMLRMGKVAPLPPPPLLWPPLIFLYEKILITFGW